MANIEKRWKVENERRPLFPSQETSAITPDQYEALFGVPFAVRLLTPVLRAGRGVSNGFILDFSETLPENAAGEIEVPLTDWRRLIDSALPHNTLARYNSIPIINADKVSVLVRTFYDSSAVEEHYHLEAGNGHLVEPFVWETKNTSDLWVKRFVVDEANNRKYASCYSPIPGEVIVRWNTDHELVNREGGARFHSGGSVF